MEIRQWPQPCWGVSVVTCRRAEVERAVFLSDVHVPFHDEKAVALAMEFVGWFKPHVLFLVGDILDFYSVSRFDKDPSRVEDLQDEIDQGARFLGELGNRCKKARKVYIQGNHEHRLARYLWGKPELAGLRGLQLPALLNLGPLGYEHHGYYAQVPWHGLLVEHGDRVRVKAGYTASGMLDARGVCGLSGHTHRLSQHFRRHHSGTTLWAENGCLCSLEPPYGTGRPDWQQGFHVGFAEQGRHRRFHLQTIPILDGRLLYQGNLWAA